MNALPPLPTDPQAASSSPAPPSSSPGQAPRRATVALLLAHPAHFIALGAGSGLSPVAPGTVGTAWAWLSFWALSQAWGTGVDADLCWAALLTLGLPVGWWASTHTARSLRVADPSAVVWDEILAFWLVLWVIGPVGWWGQAAAFALFRYFDAAKPGPVAWADGLFKARPGEPIGWAQGWGIIWDDLVAALCTLLVMAFVQRWWSGTLF